MSNRVDGAKRLWTAEARVGLQENMPTGVKYSQQVWEETLNPGEREEVWN